MKAIVYHADYEFAWGSPVGDTYKRLFKGFREQCHKFGMQLVHLTVQGHEGWGDENIHFDLSPKNVVLNRYTCFSEYLSFQDEVCWFTEADTLIHKMWPPLKSDCAMLYRPNDGVSICPAWIMTTKKATPLFREIREMIFRTGKHDWHGDSLAFAELHKKMGSPVDWAEYNGLTIEFRDFGDYIKKRETYSRNYMGDNKQKLIDIWGV